MRTLLIPALLLLGCAAPPPPFDERILDTLPDGARAGSWRFSRDGRIVAYVRYHQQQDRVVVNGVAGRPLSLI